MSQWTHIAGCIRVDCLRMALPPAMYNDAPRHLREMLLPGLPSGSEGPPKLIVWENPYVEHLAAYAVTIVGDLRDFDCRDVSTIEQWLQGIAKSLNPQGGEFRLFPGRIRNAIIEASVESRGEKVWRWSEEPRGTWVCILDTLITLVETEERERS